MHDVVVLVVVGSPRFRSALIMLVPSCFWLDPVSNRLARYSIRNRVEKKETATDRHVVGTAQQLTITVGRRWLSIRHCSSAGS